jgi:tRNA nucleotidyltransferase (CCA-adding enzyme)
MDVLKKVLLKIEPTQEEAAETRKFAGALIKILKRYSGSKKIVLAGSIAKGTYLREKADIDIFVIFKEKLPKLEMKKQLEDIMMGAFPGTRYQLNYAEHPYIRFRINGRQVDLVPAYKMKIGGERLTAVDRSVLHTRYIMKNLKKKQRKDVLLLKQLLTANGIYGAEIRIEGFSGYLCELLILRYKSFRKLMKEAKKWKLPVIIDLKKYYKPKDNERLVEKFDSEFIVIDPTDKNRNVAAALSEKNLKKFIALCRKGLSANMFFRKPETFVDKLENRKRRYFVYVIELPRPRVVDDVLWGQLKKLMKQLGHAMEEYRPAETFASVNRKVKIAIPLKEKRTAELVECNGPPANMKKHVDKFRKMHRKAVIVKRKGRVVAMEKRKAESAEKALLEFFRKHSKTDSHLACPVSRILIRQW